MNTFASPPRSRRTNVDGWHVTPLAQAPTVIVAVPAVAIGFLLTLSVWFMSVGLPLFVAGFLSIRGVLRADAPGAPHPATCVLFLALLEGALGIVALDLLPESTGRAVGTAFFAAAAFTGLAAWTLRRQTEPRPPPPPPNCSTDLIR